jgi:hypothetical protein
MQLCRLVLVVLALSLTTASHASDDWPTTVEEAARDIVSKLSAVEEREIRWMAEDKIISLHFTLGLRIRNRYGLWRGNDKLILSACGRPCHPDDASMIIIEAVWHKLHKWRLTRSNLVASSLRGA